MWIGLIEPGGILLVEDKELNRKVVRIVLKAQGYKVLEAQDAEDTLKILQAETPDLILMDIALPGTMDGEELTRQIKAEPHVSLRSTAS